MTAPLRNCRHCPWQVVRDADGRWVHVGTMGYQCRTTEGVTLPTYAEGAGPNSPPAGPPSNPGSHW